jgi:hypothetical protein
MLIITAGTKHNQNVCLSLKYESLYFINSPSETLVLCVLESLAPLYP